MYTVKQVSEKVGTSAETIRYYTRIGIIHPRKDTNNGYRYYSERDIYLIEFVRKAKQYGLTIHEVREILTRSHQGESPCPLVRDMVRNRYHEVREKIQELLALESKLALAVMEWESTDDHIPTEELICPLIEKGLGAREIPETELCCVDDNTD